MITFADIQAARERLGDAVERTPCDYSGPLSELAGCRVFCKLESLQATGSFKERGARNALLLQNAEQRKRGVIAASAGNHALALAYHGRLLSIPVTVVMPRFAPLIKQVNCRRRGAEVILQGDTFQEARAHAEQLCQQRGLTYVHGFDDPAIIAGQGTVGIEICEQLPEVNTVVIPIGGGGLIAGSAIALKHLKPQVKIVGVEPEVSPSFTQSKLAGSPVAVGLEPTLADGLAVSKVGTNAFAHAKDLVDEVVRVSEAEIALAVVRLMELEKCVVEGAAAAALAPLLSRRLNVQPAENLVLVLSGGNIDLTIIERLIETALIHDGRLLRFTATISDRPGGLAGLSAILAECGVSVKDIFHDRAFSGPHVARVNVVCTVETRDAEHQQELLARLTASGLTVWRDERPSA